MSSAELPQDLTPLRPDEKRLLRAEVLSLLYASTRRTTLVALLVAAPLVATQYRFVTPSVLLAWGLVFFLVYGAREWLAWGFRHQPADQADGARWLNLFRITSGCSGLVWGLVGFYFYPAADAAGQAFLVVALVGVSSGATMVYLVDNWSGRFFCAGLYALALPGFFNHGSSFSISLALLLAFFLVYINMAGATFTRNLRENIVLRIVANERARVAHDLAQRHALHIEQTPMGVIECNDQFEVIAWNAAAEKIFGYRADEIMGRSLQCLVAPWEAERAGASIRRLFSGGTPENNRTDNLHKDGSTIVCHWFATPLKDINGKVTAAATLVVDITESQKSLEAVHQLAYYDVLTQLPNRRLLLDRIGQSFTLSARKRSHGAIVFLDLDRFKNLNDMKGHAAGDLLLKQVAQRLKDTVRGHDTVSRFGGDEFVVVLEELGATLEDALSASRVVAQKIIKEINQPFDVDGYLYQTSPSLGICLFYADELSVTEVLKRADMAMYQAKQAGRNTLFYFNETLQPMLEARASLEADLRHALSADQLQPYYQIQVDAQRRPLGAELLLRWLHPVRGWVSPGEFIPIAEESNLICELGDWVLNAACAQIRAWQDSAGARALRLSVNISARQFEHDDFVDQVARLLSLHACQPRLLRLELTEGLMLKKSPEVIEKLVRLKAMGLSLSIDDFGTGYSSLAVLKHFPLDELKIDRGFVSDLPGNADDAILIKTIVAMGQNLGLEVIAEGVETQAQFDFLRQSGCYAYQGYWLGRPMAVEAFDRELEGFYEALAEAEARAQSAQALTSVS
ncbi:EAL domain-containing protein [Curvibacter sp. HBC28]|uniref:EAL domain-containing protein n=1 Tax=Curvibacter microcysteis TaxID=3026419 RepID=A0ABT5MD86_9BURK|nr:GGDEF domain-containing phosphodiesterase [Curvibacter sp. HBC28]MDD0814550.1 EAL domain-containing protein [Curvibacter sp. HBC28]